MEFFKEVNIRSWETIQTFCSSKWDGNSTIPLSIVDNDLAYLASLIEPEIMRELGSNVKVKNAIMFISPPNYTQNMHVDGYKIDRVRSSNTALNLPILNCDSGLMMWYDGEYFLEESKGKPNQLKYLKLNWTGVPRLVCSKVINKPTVVKIDTPHQVVNQSPAPRLMLSVRFNQDIQLG